MIDVYKRQEKDIPLTTSQQYELTNTSYSNYYQTLPTNPNVYEEVLTFSSAELDKISGKLSPNQPFKLTELVVNSQGLPLFKLSNGQFVVADKRSIYDDTVSVSYTHLRKFESCWDQIRLRVRSSALFF